MTKVAAIAVLWLALVAPAAGEGRRGAGTASFRHGTRAYRLPLETIDVEELDPAGRREFHVSLVYRGGRNRVFAIAFVHRGPGPLAATAAIDLTVSTAAGLSMYQRPRATCDIEITAGGPGAIEGRGSCRGLTNFGGERAAPDVTRIQFSGRAATVPPSTGSAPRAG